MKHFFKTPLIFILSLLLVTSCNDDDDAPQPEPLNDIAELAIATSDLSVLVQALTKADLVTTVKGDGPFTVFAPTNDAFTALLNALGDDYNSLDDFDTTEEIQLLSSILTYHVVSGKALSTDLTNNQTLTTVNTGTLTVSTDGGVFIQDASETAAQVTTADVEASNGVVHIINKVLLPQAAIDFVNSLQAEESSNIADLAIATNSLSSLVAALTRANLVDTIKGEGPFTVFAPTNDAFTAFLSANNFGSLEDVPVEVLTQVLLNHVVSGNVKSTDLTTGYVSSLSTAGAEGRNLSLFINTDDGVAINNVATVTTADVEASNGVVHIVDGVIGLPNIVDHATANPALTSLVGALTANGNTTFTDLLSSTNETFTVFAPVNDAFANFTNPSSNDINSVLAYHVIAGDAAYADELMNMYATTAATNADGDALSQYINTDDGVKINGTSNVAIADVVTTNGVVHAVDAVIDLPTVVTFAVADPTFAPLVTALTSATPETDFAGVLSGTGPFTVFAPTNTAFDNLLNALELSEVSDINEGLLTSVLNHHVVSGNIRSGDLIQGANPAPTLEGDNITITLPGTGDNIADVTDGSGNTDIGIIAVDVQANNGVIHVLNKVMLPNTEE